MINLISAFMEVSSVCFWEYMESGPNPEKKGWINVSSSTWVSQGVLNIHNLKHDELSKCQLLILKGNKYLMIFGCFIILS